MRKFILKYCAIMAFGACIILTNACRHNITDDNCGRIDNLNDLAYKYHYVSLDSVEKFANLAIQYEKQNNYDDGKYEALCHIAFAKYMRLDYIPAENILKQVIDNSENQLYALVADVIMMRICQRRSENNEFFIYYNQASEKMRRIRQDIQLMTKRQRYIWNFAVSEFYFANSVYNYYTRQEQKESEDLQFVKNNFYLVENDTAQEAMLYFLMGNTRFVDNKRPKENVKYLLKAAALAYNADIKYILAKSLSTISEDLAKPNNYTPEDVFYIKHNIIKMPDSIDNNILPIEIAEFVLDEFKQYGSLFDISQTYIAAADYFIQNNEPQAALDNMKQALECINQHHKIVDDDGVLLKPEYDPQYNDSVSIEKKWIINGVVCVPEWIMDVREHLSLVYALTDSKADCFFNRNVYLDLLEQTRQDLKIEQQFQNLKKEQKDLNQYMILALALIIIFIFMVYLIAKKIRQNFFKNYLKEKKAVENEMQKWRTKTDEDFSFLEEKQEMVNAEKISKEIRLEEQKRQYINKTTCLAIVYAISPFLDRAVNQVEKLKKDINRLKDNENDGDTKKIINEKLEYINELIQRINLYNDILANWIKIRQGEVALNVEKFELKPLFDIMEKNSRLFTAKGITLSVGNTNAIVKADRALTLFMMNTLLDNARKYSDKGGTVKLFTQENEQFVDIIVQDQGRGMSQDDVNTIMQEKVYDSSKIGDQNDSELKKNKGFGFGILNCKGIIEKYKKTSDFFKICNFGVDSQIGKGSKFFFRLPKTGTAKVLIALFMSCLTANAFADNPDSSFIANNYEWNQHFVPLDSVHARASGRPDHPLINKANYFAELAYENNLNEQWENTLQCVDSACAALNQYYTDNVKDAKFIISLYDDNNMPDIDLWNSGFQTDYHTILDIRNEAAIAAMALNDIKLYNYNNEIYHRLYKRMTSDVSMEQRCDETRKTIDNHKTLFVVLIVLVIMGIIIFLFIYYHNNIVPTFALRQILELNRRIFNNNDEKKIAGIIQDGMDNIRRTDGVGVMIGKDTIVCSDGFSLPDYIKPVLKDAVEKKEKYILDEGKTRIYPLITEQDNCIGAIAFALHNVNNNEGDDKLFNMIAQYTAVNMYFSSIRMEKINENIELIQDEKRKTEREGNIVHVQNLVIDNTLSTIKHETMYYPNRIKQIADKMEDKIRNDEDNSYIEDVNTMYELITYYKEVFKILGDCAAKQIVKPMFRRKIIELANVKDVIEKNIRKYNRIFNADIKLNIQSDKYELNKNNQIIADETMMAYLIENVVEAVLDEKKEGSLDVCFDKSEDFIKFAFEFQNHSLDKEEIKTLFYPEVLKYDKVNDKLKGAQLLLAKQIVREHDEHVRRGCRIFVEQALEDGTGIRVTFTIPANRNKTEI